MPQTFPGAAPGTPRGYGDEVRLFVSLVPPPPVLAALPPPPEGVRPVPPGSQHLTLAFLGELPGPDGLVPALSEGLAGALAPVLRLAGTGTFGRVLWVGVAGELAVLARLARDVQRAVRAAGVDLDRRHWRPHVTVGRGRVAALPSYEGAPAAWDRLDLVRSHLSADGARHEVLHRWQLRS